MVQWLARLPGTQEIRGSSPGRGMTDFCTSIVNIHLYIYMYIYVFYPYGLSFKESITALLEKYEFICMYLFPT